MPDKPPPPRFDLFGPLVLGGLLLLFLAGWLLFPHLAAWMHEQDCIASFRTNCVQY